MTFAPNDLVSFYGNPVLHKTKKLITDQHTAVYLAGRSAYQRGLAVTENPYSKDDDAIWSKYDVWNEGYLSVERS